ncbi:hypothetical protein DL93DRAFT_2090709, partial [Clavulina sp. PMI_390]
AGWKTPTSSGAQYFPLLARVGLFCLPLPHVQQWAIERPSLLPLLQQAASYLNRVPSLFPLTP